MLQTNVVEKIKTHILCSVNFFSFENCVVYEKMWKNNVERGRPQITIWPIAFSMLDTKGYKYTHTQVL